VREIRETAALAQRVLKRLRTIPRGRPAGPRRCSIGIAFHPTDGQDGDALLKYSDIALYCAKAAGRGTYRFFNTQMNAGSEREPPAGKRPSLGARQPVAELHFQPKFACNSLSIVGFEALVRWRHPTRVMFRPKPSFALRRNAD